MKMKECGVSIIGFGKCCDRSGNGCVLMENEEVPRGDLGLLHEAFSKEPTFFLEMTIIEFSKHQQWGRRCLASEKIIQTAQEVLNERKLSSNS